MKTHSITENKPEPLPLPESTYTVTMELTLDQMDQFCAVIGSVRGSIADCSLREVINLLYRDIYHLLPQNGLGLPVRGWWYASQSLTLKRRGPK